MSGEKFTKGEWVIWGDWAINDNNGNLIASFGAPDQDTWEGFANAHLITCAPEMYHALNDIVKLGLDDDCKINIDSLNQLLAKARGEL